MRQHGLLRDLSAAELSDGTLRFVMLAVALLTPRPPELIVLNEPETSFNASLLPALARLIKRASQDTQIMVVSHAEALVEALKEAGALRLELHKELGETHVEKVRSPRWTWPSH